MYWKNEAINKLRIYKAKKTALENIPNQIEALTIESTALRSSAREGSPVSGSGFTKEESLINNIVERDELTQNYDIVKLQIEAIEKGLSVLEEDELLILERFYINRRTGFLERLCEELHLEQSQIYRKKDAALRKFVTAMYGVQDI